MTTHAKYRAHGRKTYSLPFLKWVHRFGRARIRYPLVIFDRVRNYYLGFQEAGLDTKTLHDQFVKTGRMKQETWDFLVEDPENHISVDLMRKRKRSGSNA